jgi:ATP adenylyltransferase
LIGNVNDTHMLVLNIYPLVRPHYLLLTLNSYQSQMAALDIADVTAAWSVIHAFCEPAYAMYNCGREAGCSRAHRHLHVLSKPRGHFGFFPDMDDVEVPYKYFLHRFNDQVTIDEVYKAYMDLLGECHQALIEAGEWRDGGDMSCPHNVILVKDWVLVIPRRKTTITDLIPNGAGMIGQPAVLQPEDLDRWMEEGPSRVLQAASLSPDEND